MGLSCSCPYDDDAEWYWYGPEDYTTLTTKRRRRCISCKCQIDIGAICARFNRNRCPTSEIEERIYGDGPEIPMAPWWMCERCADLYFSLTELGYCIYLGEDSMLDLVKEYADEHAPQQMAA